MKSVVSKHTTKPKRRRTKKLYNDIREQVEFYFSRANLHHNSHFREIAGEDGTKYVALTSLLKFNAFKKLTIDTTTLVRALKSSVLLELSEDNQSIHRRYAASNTKKNTSDSCILYMENLPNGACIDWLKELTKKIGKVEYISLPRYIKSGNLKGFAFIEFSRAEEVQRACRIFADPPLNFFPKITEAHKASAKRSCQEYKDEMIAKNHDLGSSANECEPETTEKQLQYETSKNIHRRYSQIYTPASEKLNSDFEEFHSPAKRSRSNPIEDNNYYERSDFYSYTVTSSIQSKSYMSNGVARNSLLSEEFQNHKTTRYNPSKVSFNDNAKICTLKKESSKNKAINSTTKQSHAKLKNSQLGEQSVNGYPEDKEESRLKNGELKSNSESNLKRKRAVSEPSLSNNCHDELSRPSKLSIINEENTTSSNSMSKSIVEIIEEARNYAKSNSTKSSSSSKRSRSHHSTKLPKPNVSSKIVNVSKKSRKRSRKSTIWKELERAKQKIPKVKVMPKTEWLSLKRQYKEMQRDNLGKLKRSMNEIKSAGARSVFIKKHMDVLNKDDENIESSSSDSSSDSEEGDNDEEMKKSKLSNSEDEKNGPPTFSPGVILKLTAIDNNFLTEDPIKKTKKPCFKKIKSHLEKHGKVAYVDVLPNNEVYVRYGNSISAQKAILDEHELPLNLLTGTAEENYWEKLLQERAKKFARERKKIRGRTKLVKKAEKAMQENSRKHIRFDHDF